MEMSRCRLRGRINFSRLSVLRHAPLPISSMAGALRTNYSHDSARVRPAGLSARAR